MLSRGVSRFSIDFFGLTVLTNCVGNHSNLPEKFGFRNFQCMRTENHVFQTNFIVPEYAKSSWEQLLSFRLFGIATTFMHITVFLRFFSSHSTKKLLEEPSKISESCKCQVSKKMMQENGISRFSVEIFCLSAENFRWGTLRYIRKVQLSKNFVTKRLISFFFVEFFFTYTAYKVPCRTLLCFRIFGTSKTFMLSRRQRDFPSVFFGLPLLKIFVSSPVNLTEKVGFRNFQYMRTKNHVLQSKIFVSQYAKISWVPLLSFRIFGLSTTYMHITVYLRIFLSQRTGRTSWGTI